MSVGTLLDKVKCKCYICWETVDIIRCYQCNYGVCGQCLVKDDRFSTVVPRLCRHPECAYSYLDKEEVDKQNCFVCSKQPVYLEYTCGMCVAHSQINIKSLVGTLKQMALKQGSVQKKADIINQKLVYYTIKDLDTGVIQLKYFWEIPPPSNVNEEGARSDYLINQT